MEIRYDKAAVKFLQGLPQKLRYSIREAIKGLTQEPPKGDIKPMQGYKDGRHRLRVGKYRVIYWYTPGNDGGSHGKGHGAGGSRERKSRESLRTMRERN